MLRKSELFIKKQASDQKLSTLMSQQAEDDEYEESEELDYNSQSQSNENNLPMVHPQESSFMEEDDGENGFDEYDES